jgi:two-component system, NarL family, sensor histidine kinase EvgS
VKLEGSTIVSQVRRARRHTAGIWLGAAVCAAIGAIAAVFSVHAGLLCAGIALGLGGAGLLTTVSVRREAAGEIAKLKRSTAEKDSFLASVSHELRTPLTAVVGMLDLVVTDRSSFADDEIDEMLGTARNEAAELARLVEDYLTAGQISADALTVQSIVVDLDYEINRVASGLPHPEGMRITVGADLGECIGDALRVRQIVRNLLRNALRYGHSAIDVAVTQGDGRVTIDIKNDGEPVPAEMIDQLFQPFSGVPRPGQPESIGLGLSISRDLARRMGGDLHYVHDEGWTTFKLALPLAPSIGAPRQSFPESIPVG